jgi:hypothetical protein
VDNGLHDLKLLEAAAADLQSGMPLIAAENDFPTALWETSASVISWPA